jgi:plasmid maintenance system antidote protein VapI
MTDSRAYSEVNPVVGRTIKANLATLKMSLTAIAHHLGTSPSNLRYVLDGDRCLSPELAARLHWKFDLDTQQLLIDQVLFSYKRALTKAPKNIGGKWDRRKEKKGYFDR